MRRETNEDSKHKTKCDGYVLILGLSMNTNNELNLSLCQYINEIIDKYFAHVDTCEAANLYQMILQEVEVPLFKAVMKHTQGNVSKAAGILGINRGTLRKKLKECNF